MTREERLNNPMGVRKTSITWQGEVAGGDTGFETFDTAEDGIRAGARCLLTYFRQHGCHTVREIITRFAPSSDNNPTAKYAAYVAGYMGDVLGHPINEGSTILDLEDLRQIEALVAAIIHFENGEQPYPASTIRMACARACGLSVAPPPVVPSPDAPAAAPSAKE
jgi:hypothetical protein